MRAKRVMTEPSNGVMDHRKAECWSNGVMEYCGAPPLQHSTTPSRQISPTLRLAGRLLIGAGLLAVALTGCGPSSDKAGKPSGTNGARTGRVLREPSASRREGASGPGRRATRRQDQCRANRSADWREQERGLGRRSQIRLCGEVSQSASQPRVLSRGGRYLCLPVPGGSAGSQVVEGEVRQGRKGGAPGDDGESGGQAGQEEGESSHNPFLQRAPGRRSGAAAMAIRRPRPGVRFEPRANQLCGRALAGPARHQGLALAVAAQA